MATYVLTFESTHAAMAASKALSSGGFGFQTIPVPVAINAGCGIALRFEQEDPTAVLERVFGTPPASGNAALYRKVAANAFERDAALGMPGR